MRVTLFGASGLLGQDLVQALEGTELTAPLQEDADLRDSRRIGEIVSQTRPEWVLLSAAYTDVDGCESKRDLAMSVNCEGAVNVAYSARQNGARLMFISTDYVFDGTKTTPYETSDARHPVSVYGETKARAEARLLDIVPEVCIVRTSWLFGRGGKCFPETMLKLAASRPEIQVVNDQRGSPTYTRDLAATLVELCRKQARGIVHVTNAGDCTWFEFAREIVQRAGLAAEVKPIDTAGFPRPARRPAYSVLSPESLHAYGIRMPDWRDALGRYLAEVGATRAAKI
jgi:dTDP-4-dehydrorhamnose reductase